MDAFSGRDVATSRWMHSPSYITATPGALPGLVALLAAGHPAAVQEKAAWAVRNLAAGDEALQIRIAATPGVFPALVALMAAGNPAAVQMQAAAALHNLAASSKALQDRIAATPGALPGLVALLAPFPWRQEIWQQCRRKQLRRCAALQLVTTPARTALLLSPARCPVWWCCWQQASRQGCRSRQLGRCSALLQLQLQLVPFQRHVLGTICNLNQLSSSNQDCICFLSQSQGNLPSP